MRRVVNLYQSSVGKKIVDGRHRRCSCSASSLVHMIGNLKIYQGAEKFNAYAAFLREFGYPALGHGAVAVDRPHRPARPPCGLHIVAALQLYLHEPARAAAAATSSTRTCRSATPRARCAGAA